jgi:hypothetical protein
LAGVAVILNIGINHKAEKNLRLLELRYTSELEFLKSLWGLGTEEE